MKELGWRQRLNRAAISARFLALELAILLLLVGLPALFFWPLLTSNPADISTLPAGDFTDLHYPCRVFLARELAAGRFPLWNPYVSAGHSSLGDIQFDIFYPITYVFSRWSSGNLTPQMLELEIVAHFVLAGLFTYLFARRILSSRFGALISALAFTYGGYLTSFPVQQVIILQVSIWLPLILFFLDLGFGYRSVGCFVLAGLVLAIAALAGHPQTLGYVCIGAGLYFAYRSYQAVRWGDAEAESDGLAPGDELQKLTERESSPRAWARLLVRLWIIPLGAALFVGVGLGAAAIQLLPALEHLALTSRTDVSYAFTSSGFALHELLGLLLPTGQGGEAMYVGVVTLLLAGSGLAFSTRRGPIYWAGLAVLALLVSLGGNTFLRSALYTLALGLQFFRNHERTVFLFSFAMAILAGYGAVWLAEAAAVRRPAIERLIRGTVWLGLATVALSLLFYLGGLLGPDSARSAMRELTDRAFFTSLLCGLVIGLLYLRLRLGVSAAGWKVLLAALIVLDLFTSNWQHNLRPGDPQAPFAPPESVLLIQRDTSELFRVASEGLLPGDGNAGSLYGFYDVVGNSPLETDSYAQFTQTVQEWQRWRLLNVKYILTKREFRDPRFRLLRDDKGVRLYELLPEHRLPRAFIVHQARFASNLETALSLTNQIDPAREVVLETASEPTTAASFASEESSARVENYSSDTMFVRTQSSTPGWLVISEVYYPGWVATVDGKTVPILRADGTLRAMLLPSGSHEVSLHYAPSSLARGRNITLVTLALAALVVIIDLSVALARLLLPGLRRAVPLASEPPGL